jgi:cytochrome c-type biogenesis protein CcmE
MDPARKRTIRLVVSLSAALLLATGLLWQSFNASSEAKTPSQLLAMGEATGSYQLTGKVVEGSIVKKGNVTRFEVRDRDGRTKVPVTYSGAIPDPFREGREIIITVRKQGNVYVGEKDTLVTKCPSKFTEKRSPEQATQQT